MTSPAQSPDYPPAAFQETRREALLEFIRTVVFGQLIVGGPDGPIACGLPFVVEEAAADAFTLEAHVPRANPLAQYHGCRALALFQGPHAYIRPGWYPTKAHTGRVVPTWDYMVVHVRGGLEILEAKTAMRRHLDALTAQQERPFPDPWAPSDAPPAYVDGLMNGIVGVRLRVTALEGIWKLSQNHPEANRRGLIEGLRALDSPDGHAIAAAVAEASMPASKA